MSFFEELSLLSRRQDHLCAYCGLKTRLVKGKYKTRIRHLDATRDHVIPLKRGGADNMSNLVMACKRCNELKGHRDVEVFKEELRYLFK